MAEIGEVEKTGDAPRSPTKRDIERWILKAPLVQESGAPKLPPINLQRIILTTKRSRVPRRLR